MRPFALAAILAFFAQHGKATAAPATDDSGPITATSLRAMNQTQLDQVYAKAQPGEIPNGDSHGTAVFFPGSPINTATQMLAALAWQGKVFDTEDGVLVNKVFGFKAIKAKVYPGVSIFDGKDSIIIDYSKTSILAHNIRDEIREVGPKLYLGRAYLQTLLGDFMVVNFILDFNN